jgi:hypothetical protein
MMIFADVGNYRSSILEHFEDREAILSFGSFKYLLPGFA